MNASSSAGGESAFRKLRRLARPREPEERCDFCSVPLAPAHRHLLEIATRKIICACDPCALRFEGVAGRYKLIPRDGRSLPDFRMSDAEWESLALPISLAFLFYSTPAKRVMAMYPSPAGATESLLTVTSWEALLAGNPVLRGLEADVEALLVKRLGGAGEYFVVPIDVCFQLVGIIRLHWRGFSGGDNVWKEIDRFFGELRGTVEPKLQGEEAAHA